MISSRVIHRVIHRVIIIIRMIIIIVVVAIVIIAERGHVLLRKLLGSRGKVRRQPRVHIAVLRVRHICTGVIIAVLAVTITAGAITIITIIIVIVITTINIIAIAINIVAIATAIIKALMRLGNKRLLLQTLRIHRSHTVGPI